MELYKKVAYDTSARIALEYSTSFGISSRLFSATLRPHIYAIYGLMRATDEIADTYDGPGAEILLDELERDTYRALEISYSTNPIVYAFALTARQYGITKNIIEPFFTSMKMDAAGTYHPKSYENYIHGSAETVGLMCLKVFCSGDEKRYEQLADGAIALGRAYQKVNFLRDIAADHTRLGRVYFPDVTFDTFDDKAKQIIIDDIKKDFDVALRFLPALPPASRRAVRMSYVYYSELLCRLERTPAADIKTTRIRVPSPRKISLLIRTLAGNQHA